MKQVGSRPSLGFSLIELLIALAIMGLLASLAAPTLHISQQRRKEQELRLALREIRSALDQHKLLVDQGRVVQSAGSSGYPARLEDLENGVSDSHSPNGFKIRLLRRVPRDPMHQDLNVPAASTWGLRSYFSDANTPEEGRDVFDVYSRSGKLGLNGVPYSTW